MKKIILWLTLGLTFGCTDLDEEVLDEALNTDLLSGPGAAQGILAPVYARMNGLFNGHEDYFLLQEVSTDEAIVPYRGGTDWYNGGVLIEMHQHTWTPNHGNLDRVWGYLTQGVARAAIALNTLSDIDDAVTTFYAAEARGMAAFYNYLLLDLFNISFYQHPALITSDEPSEIYRGPEAFDFIIAELDTVESALNQKSEVGAGRFNQGAVWAIKAKMYLNRAVYLDPYTPDFTFSDQDMDHVIRYCDQIINSGQYSLETEDYFSLFDLDNHNHSEHILVLDQRDVVNNGGRFIWFTLARNQHGSLVNPQSTGTDGASATSDFYQTWANNTDDPRFYKENLPQDGTVTSVAADAYELNRGFLQGQQYGIVLNEAGTDFKRADNGDLAVEMLFNTARTGEPVDFTVAIDLTANTGHSAGVRVSKYEFDPHATNGRNVSRVDIPLIRLADIYLMRAEAKLRKGDGQGALADVNAVRTARQHPRLLAATALTLDALYQERGYELYWEMVRRTDMIRFGKYENAWTSKTNSEVYRRVFPIPQSAIDASQGRLTQNQGY